MLIYSSHKDDKIVGNRKILIAALIAAVVVLVILVAVAELGTDLPQYSGKVM